MIYDAEALFDLLAIFADEEFSLDQAIASQQNQRQKILDFLEKQVFDIVDNNLPENAKTLARQRREELRQEFPKNIENEQAKEIRRRLVTPRKRTSQEKEELILGTIVLIVICIVAIYLFLR